jgi:hypothetical protein
MQDLIQSTCTSIYYDMSFPHIVSQLYYTDLQHARYRRETSSTQGRLIPHAYLDCNVWIAVMSSVLQPFVNPLTLV